MFHTKDCRENQNTLFIIISFSFIEFPAVCDITWKNIVEPERPQSLNTNFFVTDLFCLAL